MISASVARFPLLWDEANGSLKLLKTQLLKILVSARRRDGDKHTYVHLYREIVTCACYCKGSFPLSHTYVHTQLSVCSTCSMKQAVVSHSLMKVCSSWLPKCLNRCQLLASMQQVTQWCLQYYVYMYYMLNHFPPGPTSTTPHLVQPQPLPTWSNLNHSPPGPTSTTPHLVQPQPLPTWSNLNHSPPGPTSTTPHLVQPQPLPTWSNLNHSPPGPTSTIPHLVQPQPLPTWSNLNHSPPGPTSTTPHLVQPQPLPTWSNLNHSPPGPTSS